MVISGCFAPVPTPLGADGELELEAFARHFSWLAREGLDGVLVLGSNGEFPSFDLAERRRIATAAAAVRGPLRMLLGIGSCALPEALAMVELAAELDCAGVLLPPPFYFRGAPRAGVAAFLREVLAAAGVPVLLYHIPRFTRVAVDDPLLDAIGDPPSLAGVKDSTGDPLELARLSVRFRDRTYLVGDDHLLAASLAVGGRGLIGATASVAPGLVMSVRARPELQPRLDAVRDLLEELGLGPAVKVLLRRLGFGRYATRPPLLELPPDRRDDLFRRWDELSEE